MSEKDVHTIEEVFELPSKGMIYERPINPKIKLRSMTAQDEMLRLTPSEDRYRVLTDLIDNCIIENKPDMSVYDMCMGDYTYLLHALRIVTYGTEYKTVSSCLYCGHSFQHTTKLDELEVKTWNDDIPSLFEVELPSNKQKVVLTYQTPRMLDNIEKRIKQIQKSNPDVSEEGERLIQKIVFSIKTIDGRIINPAELEAKVRNMKMSDVNTLTQKIDSLNEIIGPVGLITTECPSCHSETYSLFRYSSEFFRPTI